MKYVILIGDGMGDDPIAELGGKTVLEYAATPNMDAIASSGVMGLFKTVPDGYPPGSDVANMSIFGYDPAKYYSGRSPLEAASIGVRLDNGDTAFRCNLVTIDGTGEGRTMKDYSAGHISTSEADAIIKSLDAALSAFGVRFYTGTSYRHLMVWPGGPEPKALKTTPPHDISDKKIGAYHPSGDGAKKLLDLMDRSVEVLKDHPVNRERVSSGKRPATSIWLWGQGRAPSFPTLKKRFGVEGSIISAVDLMKGLGIYAGLEVLKVPGVTGYIDTNYRGKAEYALESLKSKDFVCVHVEAPDEAGHNGNLKDKIKAVEDFDKEVVGRVLDGIKGIGQCRILVLCDHPTPVALKTHTSDPVPFAMCDSTVAHPGPVKFFEGNARKTGRLVTDCESFIEGFFKAPRV